MRKVAYTMNMALIVILLTSIPSEGSMGSTFFTGVDLLNYCNKGEGSDESLVCVGYLTGVHDAFSMTQVKITDRKEEQFCTPEKFAKIQLFRVVLKFLEDNPEHLHRDAWLLIMTALSKAFPCNQSP